MITSLINCALTLFIMVFLFGASCNILDQHFNQTDMLSFDFDLDFHDICVDHFVNFDEDDYYGYYGYSGYSGKSQKYGSEGSSEGKAQRVEPSELDDCGFTSPLNLRRQPAGASHNRENLRHCQRSRWRSVGFFQKRDTKRSNS